MSRITEASLRAQNDTILTAILDGECDGARMEDIEHAVSLRKKIMFRPGTKVRLRGTRNVAIDGKIATVQKVGPKRIAVMLDDEEYAQYNVPVAMLEVVTA